MVVNELISGIDAITQFGLKPSLNILDCELLLEKNLVKVYNLYFETSDEFDTIDYPEFDRSAFPDIRENIISNFENFGFYKTIDSISDIGAIDDILVGDTVDDLTDITIDLLEIK